MSQITVTKSRSGPGCGWILTLPIFVFGMIVCCGGIAFATAAANANNAGERQRDLYIEQAAEVDSARLEVIMEAGEIRMGALGADASSLFEADLNWLGNLEYGRIDAPANTYRIEDANDRSRGALDQLFGFLSVANEWETDSLAWDIDLNDRVPFSLDVRGSVGSIALDLRTVNLTGLYTRISVGELTLSLPEPQQSYTVELVNNTGATTITLPPNASVEIIADIDAGTIDTSGLDLIRFEFDESDQVGESGVWRSEGFEDAEFTITIAYTGGIGELIIK